MELLMRKQNRLQGYDYSAGGAYFITVCVSNRDNLLWDKSNDTDTTLPYCVFSDERLPLSKVGLVIDNEIQKISGIYENVAVQKYCIMPDHIHLLIVITPDECDQKVTPTISRVIKQFKGSITKQLGIPIWQRSFFDRVIRNENEYFEVWKYIANNPIKWQEDDLCIGG